MRHLRRLLRLQPPPLDQVRAVRLCADSTGSVLTVKVFQTRSVRQRSTERDSLGSQLDSAVLALLHTRGFRVRGVHPPSGFGGDNCSSSQSPSVVQRAVLEPLAYAAASVRTTPYRAYRQWRHRRHESPQSRAYRKQQERYHTRPGGI